MRAFVLLALCLAAVSAEDSLSFERIVGGSVTNINNYPAMAAVLQSDNSGYFRQVCGSSILNQRSVLTAAHCFAFNQANRYRVRVGSTNANSGGTTHNINRLIVHPNYNQGTFMNADVAIMRTASNIAYSNSVRAASIAGTNYNWADNEVVWAAGWGATSSGGAWSEQLRHVQMWTISQAVCRQQYGSGVNDNMFCSGRMNVGGVSTCQGDSGGPVYHRGVVIGISSFGGACGNPNSHGVYVRVPRFTSWIQSNA